MLLIAEVVVGKVKRVAHHLFGGSLFSEGTKFEIKYVWIGLLSTWLIKHS